MAGFEPVTLTLYQFSKEIFTEADKLRQNSYLFFLSVGETATVTVKTAG